MPSNFNMSESRGLPILELLAALGHYAVEERSYSEKDRFRYLCPLPGHNDTRPSFTVSGDGWQWTCWPCGHKLQGVRKLRELLGNPSAVMAPPRPAPKPPKTFKKVRPQRLGCTLAALKLAKGLPVEHLKAMGWRDSIRGGVKVVLIPYPVSTAVRIRWEIGKRDDGTDI